MMNKKGFIARDFVLAMLLFSGIIALAALGIASLASDYDNPNVVDEDFQDNFDRFTNETDRASDLFDAATSNEGLSLIGTFDVLFSASFTVISLVFGGVSAVGSQVAGFASYFGIPSTVAKTFFTILLSGLAILMVFIIISSVSRRDL